MGEGIFTREAEVCAVSLIRVELKFSTSGGHRMGPGSHGGALRADSVG